MILLLIIPLIAIAFYSGRLIERRQRRFIPPPPSLLTPPYSRLLEYLQTAFANDPRAQLTLSVDEKSGHIAVLPSTNHDK